MQKEIDKSRVQLQYKSEELIRANHEKVMEIERVRQEQSAKFEARLATAREHANMVRK